MNIYNFKLQQICYLGFTIIGSFDLYNTTGDEQPTDNHSTDRTFDQQPKYRQDN